jgi:hypothetical protein
MNVSDCSVSNRVVTGPAARAIPSRRRRFAFTEMA